MASDSTLKFRAGIIQHEDGYGFYVELEALGRITEYHSPTRHEARSMAETEFQVWRQDFSRAIAASGNEPCIRIAAELLAQKEGG